MKRDMGSADKIVRIILAVFIALLLFINIIGGTAGFILMAVAGVPVVTSFISFCPLYSVFGINTCKTKN